MTTSTSGTSTYSRRTVAKGIAWATPAIAVAQITPAFATSGPPPTGSYDGICKLPGSSCGAITKQGYLMRLTLTNNTGEDIYLWNESPPSDNQITVVRSSGLELQYEGTYTLPTPQPVTFPYLLQSGESIIVVLHVRDYGNSSNQSGSGVVYIPWGHGATGDPNDHPPLAIPYSFTYTDPVNNPSCTIGIQC